MATSDLAETTAQIGDDGIGLITLSRPEKRNALTIRMRKRYLSGNQGLGFEESFRVEHDDVFDQVLRQSPLG